MLNAAIFAREIPRLFYDEVPTRSARHVFQHGALEYPINSDRLKIGSNRTCLALHEPLLPFLGILLALVCFALFVYYPAFPESVAGWLGLLFIGVPLLFSSGSATSPFGVSFFNRPPSAGRVALGVPNRHSCHGGCQNGSLAALLNLSTVSKLD